MTTHDQNSEQRTRLVVRFAVVIIVRRVALIVLFRVVAIVFVAARLDEIVHVVAAHFLLAAFFLLCSATQLGLLGALIRI